MYNKKKKKRKFIWTARITLTLTIFVMQNIFKKISLRLSRIIVLNKRRRKLYIFGRKTVRLLPEFDAPIYVSTFWQKVLNSRKEKANNSYMNCVWRYGNEYVQLQRLFWKKKKKKEKESLVKKNKTWQCVKLIIVKLIIKKNRIKCKRDILCCCYPSQCCQILRFVKKIIIKWFQIRLVLLFGNFIWQMRAMARYSAREYFERKTQGSKIIDVSLCKISIYLSYELPEKSNNQY